MNEAELLFTEILNYSNRTDLYLNKDSLLAKDKAALVSTALKRRANGEPIQYILGKTEFMGLEFRVDKSVLIPRQETEILVEKAIDIVHSSKFKVQSILDIGTGSGCIAISLAKFIKNINVTASDISGDALKIAKQNASLNNAEVTFLQSDLFAAYDLTPNTYDLIVSNPPYVATAEIEHLQPEISYEPRIALDGGRDRMDFYRRIIAQTPAYLKKEGYLIMEMGFNQCSAIKEIFNSFGNFRIVEVVKDYTHIDRVIVTRKN